MLAVSSFENKVSYLVGSALSIDDLCKAGAQYASAIFVFCNPVTHEDDAGLDDAANVLRALSVTNFNPGIELFVQIIRSEDREMLRNSNVDVVLCLDEFRTAMQVSTCPLNTTLPYPLYILFHTLSTPPFHTLSTPPFHTLSTPPFHPLSTPPFHTLSIYPSTPSQYILTYPCYFSFFYFRESQTFSFLPPLPCRCPLNAPYHTHPLICHLFLSHPITPPLICHLFLSHLITHPPNRHVMPCVQGCQH